MENNLSELSDEDLMSALSDEDLKQLAGVQNTPKVDTSPKGQEIARHNNIQAQQDVSKAQAVVDRLDPSVAAIGSAYNASWPVSALIKSAIGQGSTPVPRATTGGGALLQDLGAVANPLTAEAFNLGLKGLGAGAKLIGMATNKTKGAVGRVINSFKGASSADLEAKLAQRKTDIANEKLNLEGLFKQKYKDITFKGKQVVPEISKRMSNAYEQGLDDIFSKLDDPLQAGSVLKKDAPPITNTELVNQLEGLVNKASNDPLIIKSDAYKKTVSMLDSFKNGTTSESGLLDASGKTIVTPKNEAVDIRDLISKVREIKATIKASSLEGSTPISGQDYFATQFNSTIGKLLKDRVNGFKELQASYAPMAQTRKVAYKIFKPFSDEDSTLAFLQRIKNDNLKSSDEKLLNFLQNGGVVGDKKIPGMGEFATELKNIGSRLNKLNSGIEEKQLAADIFKKASDEKFRNKVFLWTLGTIGLGTGTKKAADLVISH